MLQVLGNLARHHPPNQTAIVAAGGVECVVAAMRACTDTSGEQEAERSDAVAVQRWGCDTRAVRGGRWW